MNEFKRRFATYRENFPLAPLSTMNVGGKSRYFLVARKMEDLIEAIKIARKNKIPFLVIGGGSNIIFEEKMFPGLVVQNRTSEIVFQKEEVLVDGGLTLRLFLKKLAERNLGGLESLFSIPGTVAGAVIGNAGAYGSQIADFFVNCLLLDGRGSMRTFGKKEMRFSYRSSILKNNFLQGNFLNQAVLLRAKFRFRRSEKSRLMREMENIKNLREKKQPQGKSCGSIFKNILLSQGDKEWRDVARFGKLPAGYLIEKAGLKGKQLGGAKISEKHANWIINFLSASADDVWQLKELAKSEVKQKFNLELEEEVIFMKDIMKKKHS